MNIRKPAAILAGALLLIAGFTTPMQAAPAAPAGGAAENVETAQVVEVLLSDRTELERLVALGVDLDAVTAKSAHAVVTPTELADLRTKGFRIGDVLFTEQDWMERRTERDRTIAAKREANKALGAEASLLTTDAIKVLRADYFSSREGSFLSVEAKSSSGPSSTFQLTVYRDSGPGTPMGSGGTQLLSSFVDADVYMYHRGIAPVTVRPAYIEVVSPDGGRARARVTEWLPPERPDKGPFLKDFVDHYLTPTEAYARIHQLAKEFPDLAEIIELPYRTNGYRRKAQALLGSSSSNRVVVDSRAWGHEGGNEVSLELADPGAADQPLTVSVTGKAIRVSLATDGSGAPSSTAAQVVAALNADATQLVEAYTYRGDPGSGIVTAVPPTPLSDFLHAPATVSREPHPVYALRIGRHRDGSKLGVLGYSQEHAREWVTPLVAVETAERLLRNYAHDGRTKKLLNNLDIFIAPSINPDGAHYSFYDFGGQRKNMTNYCPRTGAADPLGRNQWGVDNNRNYGAYTLWDGYFGASTSCTSGTFAGPTDRGPLSQPENRNLVWLADTHPNIRFSMNIHSSGDYFMWAPGAYKVPGRITAPRPELDEEAFFWGSSENILTEIKKSRGTVVVPGQTGPVSDVLYSAAGNSGDHLWYLNDIYAWNFEVGTAGFQPEWQEAHEQMMEYSNGLYGLFDVAYAFDKDRTRPRSKLSPPGGIFRAPVSANFGVTEPAAIFYTLDGSRPTFASTRLRASGVREGPESLLIDRTTTIKWFSVDQAGNIENGYNPTGTGRNYNEARFVISGHAVLDDEGSDRR